MMLRLGSVALPAPAEDLIPVFRLPLPLERTPTRPAWIARSRQARLAVLDGTAQRFACGVARGTTFAGMRERFRVALRLDAHLAQKAIERRFTHVVHECRDQSLDEYQALAGRELLRAANEIADRRMIEPRIEGTLPRIYRQRRTRLVWEVVVIAPCMIRTVSRIW